MIRASGADHELLSAAITVRRDLGRISDLIHAAAIVLVLPQVLEDGEQIINRPSLAAGNDPSRPYDLETNRRVAEFKLSRWAGTDATEQAADLQGSRAPGRRHLRPTARAVHRRRGASEVLTLLAIDGLMGSRPVTCHPRALRHAVRLAGSADRHIHRRSCSPSPNYRPDDLAAGGRQHPLEAFFLSPRGLFRLASRAVASSRVIVAKNRLGYGEQTRSPSECGRSGSVLA